MNWAYKNGTNKANYGPCSLRMGPVHNLYVFGILGGVCPPIDSLIDEVDLWGRMSTYDFSGFWDFGGRLSTYNFLSETGMMRRLTPYTFKIYR